MMSCQVTRLHNLENSFDLKAKGMQIQPVLYFTPFFFYYIFHMNTQILELFFPSQLQKTTFFFKNLDSFPKPYIF